MDYDEYDGMVVCHNSPSEAMQLTLDLYNAKNNYCSGWPIETDDDVNITLIGVALDGCEPGIILASFNAG